MDVTESLDLASPPDRVFAIVEDLGRYPEWLSIVTVADLVGAEVEAELDANAAASRSQSAETASRKAPHGARTGPRTSGEGPAWSVELRGRIGPLTRSKRLRMVRTLHEPHRAVRFERRELDGREHSEWILDALVEPLGSGCRVTMSLHYGGRFPTGFIEGILHDEIEGSRTRLAEAVEARTA